MKYKIFVCSSSGIEFLLQSSAIKSIPLELKTSNIEKYYENELDYNLFYSRAHLDKKMKLNVNKRTIDDIKDLISQYTNEETNIYILLSGFYNKEDAMALKNDNVFAFQYDLYGYVLSRMAITLEKTLKKNIDDLYLDMNSIKDRTFMIYSTPKKDMEFFYKLVPYIDKVSFVKKCFVHYVQRENSIANTQNIRTKEIFTILDNVIKYYKENGLYEEYKDELEYIYVKFLLCSSLKRICKISEKKERKKAQIETWNNISTKFPNWRKNPILKKKNLKNFYIKSNNKLTFKIYCIILHVI